MLRQHQPVVSGNIPQSTFESELASIRDIPPPLKYRGKPIKPGDIANEANFQRGLEEGDIGNATPQPKSKQDQELASRREAVRLAAEERVKASGGTVTPATTQRLPVYDMSNPEQVEASIAEAGIRSEGRYEDIGVRINRANLAQGHVPNPDIIPASFNRPDVPNPYFNLDNPLQPAKQPPPLVRSIRNPTIRKHGGFVGKPMTPVRLTARDLVGTPFLEEIWNTFSYSWWCSSRRRNVINKRFKES